MRRQKSHSRSFYVLVSLSIAHKEATASHTGIFTETRRTYRAVLSEPKVIIPSVAVPSAADVEMKEGEAQPPAPAEQGANGKKRPLEQGGSNDPALSDLSATTAQDGSNPDGASRTKKKKKKAAASS